MSEKASGHPCLPCYWAVFIPLFWVFIFPGSGGTSMAKAVSIPTTESFDFDWKFELGEATGAQAIDYDDSAWRPLNVPHDWSIEQRPDPRMQHGRANGFFPGGVGWYRKHFALPREFRNHKVSIQFDGVYHRSDVYLNGKHLGHRPYGYASFQYDLTCHLNFGAENVLAVRVDHSDAPTSRWYSGSGIYRHVWLTITDPLHVAPWGTYVTTPEVTPASAAVRVRTTVQNNHAQQKSCVLITTIEAPSGVVVATTESPEIIATAGAFQFDQTLKIERPLLWSVDEPQLYMVRTTVKEGNRVCDTYRTPFGVRTARFDPQQGFFLNGKNMKLKGVCLHDDAGCLGTAVPERAWERRLELLREMGCNAIRMSHNPPAPELLDLCDRMGFLVIDEAFDKWKSGYYSEHYDAWWQRDLDAMIQRDRNHPCIILWSVGNEVREQGSVEGTQRLKELVGRVHQTEPTRPVTYAAHPGRGKQCINNNGFADAMDVVCYNYQEPWYEQDKQLDPKRIIVGSECYPFWHGRSDYHTDRKLHNFYCDFAPVNPWYDVTKHDYVAGQFIWIGLDYLGESIGWPSKGWPNGLIDTCGFAKPRAGFHRSVWNAEPFIQIAVLDDSFDIDHGAAAWSWPKMARSWNRTIGDAIVRVQTVTNADSVELLLNDKSLGTRRAADYPNSTILWYVPYRPGHLTAIAKNNGREVTTDELHTAGAPVKILLKPDRGLIAADGQDIAHLEVALVDAEGVLVPNDDRKIRFEVTGSGKLAGTDNGDLRSTEPYKGNERTTRWGRCLAVVQASRQAGAIRLTATADGLPASTAVIHSRDSDARRPASERR